ncbi:coiled-coil-helix-coiled-coil-helix domain-containing protein 7 [Bacillus rossius redtenbacheri]|uniref:coiled-coil-helix-coiled-coil-helix domain-containing protein 7 n=1 Tax=Bacillus rossius redtenbacheri TaxID=93214 RepID=UPI002FDDD707
MENSVLKNTRENYQTSDYNNPCLKEHRLSLKCLDDNSYDKEKCEIFFANYKVCKAFWTHVRNERKRQGIEPFLPPPEERVKIKEEFLQKMRQAGGNT